MIRIFKLFRKGKKPNFGKVVVLKSDTGSSENIRYVSDFNIPFVENKEENSWSRVRNNHTKKRVITNSEAEQKCKERKINFLVFQELQPYFQRGLSAKQISKMFNKRGYGQRTIDKHLAIYNSTEKDRK